MHLTYLTHSCFLIETAKHRLLIDPFLSENPSATTKPADVECDYILVSHGHDDHLGDAVEIAKRTGATIIANFEVAVTCASRGAKNIHPMNPGGAWQAPFGRIKFTIAHHSSSTQAKDGSFLYLGTPCGILITADEKTLYHAGDTALFMDMKLIGELNNIDVAMLPIGDNFTMGIDDAAIAVDFLKAKLAIPMHYNTYDLIKVDPHAFAKKVQAIGAHAKVMTDGERIEIA